MVRLLRRKPQRAYAGGYVGWVCRGVSSTLVREFGLSAWYGEMLVVGGLGRIFVKGRLMKGRLKQQ